MIALCAVSEQDGLKGMATHLELLPIGLGRRTKKLLIVGRGHYNSGRLKSLRGMVKAKNGFVGGSEVRH